MLYSVTIRRRKYIDNTCYFGTVIGRSGNRIANGRLRSNGKTYQLGIKHGNNLHSGRMATTTGNGT